MANQTIGSGVFPGIMKRFKLLKKLNLNPKSNVNDINQMEPEDKVAAIATAAYGTPDEARIRSSFEVGLENAQSRYDENPSDELALELEQAKNALNKFNETIEQLKKSQEIEKETELEKNLKNSATRINQCVEEFNNAINLLTESLNGKDFWAISVAAENVLSAFKNYQANLRIYSDSKKEYEEVFGTIDEENIPKINNIELSNEQVEKIYKETKLKINELTKKTIVLRKKKYLASYDRLIEKLPKFIAKEADFAAIKEKVDAELLELEADPIEKAKQEAQVKIDKLLAELFEQYKNEFKANEVTITPLVIKNEVLAVVSEYDILSGRHQQELIDNAIGKFKKMLIDEYGKGLLQVVEKANEIITMIEELKDVEYTDPQFKTKYDALIKLIEETKDSQLFKDNKAVLIYYKNTQKIHFTFPSGKIDDISLDIVPENVKEQMRAAAKGQPNPGQPNPGQPNPGTPDKKEIEDKISAKIDELFEKYKAEMKKLDIKIDIATVSAEIGNIVDDYNLTALEKEAYIKDSIKTFKEKVVAEYGQGLLDVVDKATEIISMIEELKGVEYTDPQFKPKYDALIKLIEETKDSQLFKDNKAALLYYANTQKIHFTFPTGKIDDISLDIVPENVKEQMRAAAKGQPNPGQPNPGQPNPGQPNPGQPNPGQPNPGQPEPAENEEQKKAVEDYIRLLDELKAVITDLNNCNKAIEGAASITLDGVSKDQIETVERLEKAALKLDSSIIDKKLELSNARANLRLKYNCYISNIKEVTEYDMPKIEFSKNYQDFITYYDEMIVIAEKQIIELDKERQQEFTPESRYNELTEQMKDILRYIESVNSLINRRIVAESVENGLDIVAVLKQRREDKKEIRKKIQELLDKKAAAKPQVNQEEAERELREKLTAIYKEWLEQIALSLKTPTMVVDNESFENKVKETIDNSQAEKKYQIAEELKNQFEAEKEKLILIQKDNDFRTEVSKIFGGILLETIKKIRVDNNYNANFESICINLETTQKLNDLIAASDAPNKVSILAEEKTRYLATVRDIVKTEQIDAIIELKNDINTKLREIATLEVNDDLEPRITAIFDTLVLKYKPIFERINIDYKLNENKIIIEYAHKLFNGTAYDDENVKIELEAMSLEMFARYVEYKKQKPNPGQPDPKKPNPGQPNPGQPNPSEPEPGLEDEDLDITVPIYKVDNGRKLNLSVAKPIIHKEAAHILTVDTVQLTLLKNGLKIKYSQELRRQLQELNAKLILVKKHDSRIKATKKIKEKNEEDVVTIKRQMDDFNIEDYKVQIRADKFDDEGNKLKGTDLIFQMDIGEELGQVISEGRSR